MLPDTLRRLAPRRRPKIGSILVALGVAVTLAIFSIGTIVIVAGRQEAWSQAQVSSQNLMLALRRDLARNFQLLDLSLQGAAEALSEPGLETVSPGIFQHAVFDRSSSTEDIASFVIINREGSIAHSADHAPIPNVNVADRDYFKAHIANPDLGVYFSNVYRSRLRHGEPTVALSRRLNTPGGNFNGVVLGTIATDYFRRMFKSLELGTNGSLTLFTTSGRLVHRQPFNEEDIDRDLTASGPVQRMLVEDEGQFIGRSSIDGVERLYTFAHVTGMPLIIAVNLSVDDIYAGWRKRAIESVSVLILLCVSTLSLTLLFHREVRRRTAAETLLQESAKQLELMALTDSLTQLGNRRSMELEIAREWKRAIRSLNPLAVMMIDVDHFKLFNDKYGHPEGDVALQAVAKCLKETILRSTDTVSRYGGEEFVVLLSETETTGAMAMAERVRAHVEALRIPHAGSPLGYLSISIGVSIAYPTLRSSPAEALKAADLALYSAKRSGRNQVHLQTTQLNQYQAKALSAPIDSDKVP